MALSHIDQLYLRPVSAVEIYCLLSSITTQAHGIDGITTNMLKIIDDAAIPSLHGIVNHSLNQSIFPHLWTRALVTPIPKVSTPLSQQI